MDTYNIYAHTERLHLDNCKVNIYGHADRVYCNGGSTTSYGHIDRIYNNCVNVTSAPETRTVYVQDPSLKADNTRLKRLVTELRKEMAELKATNSESEELKQLKYRNGVLEYVLQEYYKRIKELERTQSRPTPEYTPTAEDIAKITGDLRTFNIYEL